MCFSITSLQFSLTKTHLWELQFTLISKKRQISSHNTGASTLRRTRSPTIHLFQFFFFLSLIFHFVLRHFDFSLLSFCLRGSVGFQTEITPFSSIDGVGHQSLSLGKTLSVLSLSLSIESPRCQDLLVWSFFLFSRSFSYNLPRVPFVFPQRGTGTLCSTFM